VSSGSGASLGVVRRNFMSPSPMALPAGFLPRAIYKDGAVSCQGPQGLKPSSLLALGGTAKAVPFPKPFSHRPFFPKIIYEIA
jgi:hypothetical protein